MKLLRRLFKRPRYTESDSQAQERLAAKRLAARQWLASKRAGEHWCLHPVHSPEPRSLRVVIPIRSIPTLRRAA